MPIAFMLIMSLALSRDQDPHTDSRIALVGATNDSINTALAAALEKEQIHVTRTPSEKLTDAQNGLHDKRFQLVLHNPNPASGKIADDKALQIYVPPDTEPSWLAAVKGVLQQHYTETRLDAYFDNNDGIKIDNKKLPRSIRKDIQKKVDEKNDEQFRLRLARASASGLIAAKLVPYFLINQLQFVGMLLLGRYLLPEIGVPALILNGSLVPYALLSAAVSASALGYALLISVCSKSTEHAVVLGGGGIILMAAIGGIMVPAHVMPETMQQLTWISPMAWGLKAFQELLLNRSGLNGIGQYLLLLSAFSFTTLTAAVLVYRRQLQTQVRF